MNQAKKRDCQRKYRICKVDRVKTNRKLKPKDKQDFAHRLEK